MQMACKFICAKSYDFTDKEGIHVAGTTAFCFDPHKNVIIKVKVVNSAIIEGLQFGDDINVDCIPNGRYSNYEV